MDQKLTFKVDSALLRELGEKLVETVHVALAELVKNAYDADATLVKIRFEVGENDKNCIKIIDNGIGMNFHAVENYWMRIATTNKKDKDTSIVYGRPLTGAKGIGRFSCRRLGSKLTLITRGTEKGNATGIQKDIQYSKVEFPWDNFKVGTDVTTIHCKGNQDIFQSAETGTTLIIEDISDEWRKRGMDWLKRQLAVLVANRGARRDGYIEDPGFNILLEAPDFEDEVKDLREEFINAGWGTLNAFVNSKGQAVCELDAKGLGKRKIVSSKRFSNLNDVKLHLGIFISGVEKIRDRGIASSRNLSEILPRWGGVQIRFRGFRVYPYGNDDWLNIEKDKARRLASPREELLAFAESLRGVEASRSLLNMPAMNNYIGNVELGKDAKGFEMKANREGFIDSDAMIELKDFVRFALDWTTILRDYSIREESILKAEIAKEAFEDVLDEPVQTHRVVDRALEYIDNEIRTVARNLEPNKRREVEQSISKATEVIRRQNDSNKSELSHLRLIASTSTLLLIFSHEVKSLLGLLEQSKNSLTEIAETLVGEDKDKALEIGSNFNDLNKRLTELLQLTSLISADKSKVQPGRVSLKSKLHKVEKAFELITGKYGITIDSESVPNNAITRKYHEAEIYSILLNVLSNSIKAVIATSGIRKIGVTSSFQKGKLILAIRDTGIGLNESRFSEVFTPFISDPDGELYINLESRMNPEDNLIVGTGSGIGLGIVKEIVVAHGGTINFEKPEGEWSTEIKIVLE